MKFKLPISLFLTFFVTINLYSQTNEVKYKRSSLHIVLLESEDFPNKNIVVSAMKNMPFPDKYNDHSLKDRSFNPQNYNISEEERESQNLSKFQQQIQAAKAELAVDPLENDYKLIIEKYIKETDLAKNLVAKWYNRKPDGTFDLSLIQERGFYDASLLDVQQAKGTVKWSAVLGDAGNLLIKNTFVVFAKMKFTSNEMTARLIRDALVKQINEKMSGAPAFAKEKALAAAEKVYEKTKEGYMVTTKAWLYQLNWDDSIQSIFDDLYLDKNAFDNSNLFSLSFVGKQTSDAFVGFSLKEKRTEEQIIKLATIRNFDNTILKLQKNNEVFRPVVPVLSSDPITAPIGMKEGLKGGEKFDALELTINPKSGRTEYKKVGSVTVDKKKVWDNRFNLSDGQEQEDETDDSETSGYEKVDITYFKGSKKIAPGMVLKQVKFSK